LAVGFFGVILSIYTYRGRTYTELHRGAQRTTEVFQQAPGNKHPATNLNFFY